MKKIILSVLLLGVFLVGMVAAGPPSFDPEFTSPNNGDFVRDAMSVTWTNPLNSPALYIQYQEGDCSFMLAMTTGWTDVAVPSSQLTMDLDTTQFADGPLCLRLRSADPGFSGTLDYKTVEVDNEDPVVVNLMEITPMNPGANEFDEKVRVYFEYTDNNFVDSCEIAWGDGATWDCLGFSTKRHQYGDNGAYTVTITVEDAAGNTASDSIEVEVANVDPTVDRIEAAGMSGTTPGNTVFAVGEAIEFDAINPWDVAADLTAGLVYTWNFDGTGILAGTDENPVFTYDAAGIQTVTLYLTDKDGGVSDSVTLTLEIVEPTDLTPMQEVAAYYELDLDFNEVGVSSNGRRFETSIDGISGCDKIIAPVGMQIDSAGSDKCRIIWTPTNDQRGEHLVIVKAYNGTDYEYYTFDVTVYSWIIKLTEGWNLVSIPLVAEDSSIADVFLDQLYDSLPTGTDYGIFSYQYDGTDSSWLKTRRTGYGDLDTVEPGYGYWIKTTEAATIKGFGSQLGQSGSNPGTIPEVEIPTGQWSLIGRYGIVNQVSPKRAGAIDKMMALMSLDTWFMGMPSIVYSIDVDGNLVNENSLANNEGYWMWNNAIMNVESGIYTPIDPFYSEN